MGISFSDETLRLLQERKISLREVADQGSLNYYIASYALHRKHNLYLRRGRMPITAKYGGSIELYRQHYNAINGEGAWEKFLELTRKNSLQVVSMLMGISRARVGQLIYNLTGKKKAKLPKKIKVPRIDKEALKTAIRNNKTVGAIAQDLNVKLCTVARDAKFWNLKLPDGMAAPRSMVDKTMVNLVKQYCFTIKDLMSATGSIHRTIKNRLSDSEWKELKRYLLNRRRRRNKEKSANNPRIEAL